MQGLQGLLDGKVGLVVDIGNDQSMAAGGTRTFHSTGAGFAVIYLNDNAKPYAEPFAKQLDAPLSLPRDVEPDGSLENVFFQPRSKWGPTRFPAPLDRVLSQR